MCEKTFIYAVLLFIFKYSAIFRYKNLFSKNIIFEIFAKRQLIVIFKFILY